MEKFRKLYYKLVTLFCLFATFFYLFSMDKRGVGYGCFYIFVGLLSFGSLSIGKEEIDPDKPIRNILFFLAWSLLGFGIMSMGILAMRQKADNESLMTAFLVLAGLGLMVAYIISIIKFKDWYAIISVALVVLGFFIGAKSNGMVILAILTLLTFLASIVFFVLSIIKGVFGDD